MLRYCKLWSTFGEKEFTHEQAARVLTENKSLSVILSAIRKAGWLTTQLDVNDARKRKYQLNPPETIVREMARGSTLKQSVGEIKT